MLINADQAEAAKLEKAPGRRLAFPMLAAHVAERLAKAAPQRRCRNDYAVP